MYLSIMPSIKPPYKSHKLVDILWAHTDAIGCIVLRLSRCHTSSVLAVLYKDYSLCSFIVIVLLCKQFFVMFPKDVVFAYHLRHVIWLMHTSVFFDSLWTYSLSSRLSHGCNYHIIVTDFCIGKFSWIGQNIMSKSIFMAQAAVRVYECMHLNFWEFRFCELCWVIRNAKFCPCNSFLLYQKAKDEYSRATVLEHIESSLRPPSHRRLLC